MINKKDVEHIARLARLRLSEEEKELYTKQLGQIFTYIEKLNQPDTKNVQPLSHVVEMKNVFREDIIKPSFSQEEVLANAPAKQHGHFKVKKIIA